MWGVSRGWTLLGFDILSLDLDQLSSISVETCQQVCLNTTACVAMEYSERAHVKCRLKSATRRQKPGNLVIKENVDHYDYVRTTYSTWTCVVVHVMVCALCCILYGSLGASTWQHVAEWLFVRVRFRNS